MNNGVVIFFNDNDYGWWIKDMHTVEHGFRGYVIDGCFWFDYFEDTKTINICIGSNGVINWEKPINTLKDKALIDTIVVTINSNDYLTVRDWARKIRKDNGENNFDSG